jgi:hypothetical protein
VGKLGNSNKIFIFITVTATNGGDANADRTEYAYKIRLLFTSLSCFYQAKEFKNVLKI